jgi:serine/threonine-protein kinase
MQEGTLLNNRYQLLEELGTGGMAHVFRARDLMLDRYVAIKILRQDFSNNPNFQNNFRQEARAAANLSHPNIVTVHDFGFADDMLFIVMEYIPGKDLKQLIRQRGRFSIDDAIPLIIQACAGIGYAHRAGLVHCDVKPHNMLVSPDARLKVTDFGIARALATITPGERTDIVWGSPLYFAPEQARGEVPTPASDVYSLGVVLYETLTGTPPFTASSADELARMHISARPIPIREYIPDIPTALEEIVMKVLSKEPAARYRTADQLGRVLQRFGTQRDLERTSRPPVVTPISKPVPPPEREPVVRERPEPTPVYRQPEPISRPRPIPAPVVQEEPEPEPAVEIGSAFDEIDWVSVGLGLVAVIAVGGLVPFWIIIYYAWFPK